jgi:hypothetical protein
LDPEQGKLFVTALALPTAAPEWRRVAIVA